MTDDKNLARDTELVRWASSFMIRRLITKLRQPPLPDDEKIVEALDYTAKSLEQVADTLESGSEQAERVSEFFALRALSIIESGALSLAEIRKLDLIPKTDEPQTTGGI